VLLIGCAALRLLAVSLVDTQLFADDKWYFERAAELASGAGYAFRGKPTAYFPIGYPALLAAVFWVFGKSLLTAKLLNVVMSTATVALTYGVATFLVRGTTSALLSATIVGLMPNQIIAVCMPMAEIPFTFFVLSGIYLSLVAGARQSVLIAGVGGLAFGAATLVRTQGLLMAPVVVPIALIIGRHRPLLSTAMADTRTDATALLLRHGGARAVASQILVALSIVLATLLPWAMRNRTALGTYSLATNGGDNLFIGNGPDATGAFRMYDGYFLAKDPDPISEVAHDQEAGRAALDYVKAHPKRAIALLPRKVWRLFRSDLGIINWAWQSSGHLGSPEHRAIQFAAQGMYVLVIVLTLAHLVHAAYARRLDKALPLVAVLLAMVLYFSLISMVFFGDSRFHFPLVPIFCIAAAEGLVGVRRRLRLRSPNPAWQR
jgi:hypothetical protein